MKRHSNNMSSGCSWFRQGDPTWSDALSKPIARGAIAILAFTLALVASATQAIAEDWPVVRGNTLGTGIATSELPEKLDVLWKYQAEKDAGFSATAVIAGGIVYVGDDAGTFHAIRLADGKPVWTKKFEETGFDAGAAIEGDHLYVGDMIGDVRCLALADGEKKWNVSLDAEVYAGPTPYKSCVLVTSEAGTLTSLNSADGSQQWQFHIEAPLRCTPTISGGRAMLAGCDSLLHIIDVADGREVNTVKIDAPTGSTAAMRGERVYFGTEGGTFFSIDVPTLPDKQPEVAWTYRDPERGQPIRSAAAVTEKFTVYGSQAKAIYCLDTATGEFKWKLPTRTRVDSSPIIAGERVVAATTGGKLYILDLASGKELWQYDAGGSFAASPAIVDGRILIGNTDGTLYCFGANLAKTIDLNHEDTKDTKSDKD